MSDRIQGLPPFYSADSKVLILGSFPSVKSRAAQFYYGNKQNRFWKMLEGYFGETAGESTEEKKNFLARRGIALWDVVAECEIVGSKDETIRNVVRADIPLLLKSSRVSLVLLNGAKAYRLFCEDTVAETIVVPFRGMPSTSPRNRFYDPSVWYAALDEVYRKTFPLDGR